MMTHPSDHRMSNVSCDILAYLPHRFPFLLVDRVIACTPGQQLEAIKNVSYNEPFFSGHFPEKPVMPGVLMIEALAQAAGLLIFQTLGRIPNATDLFYLASVDACRFKRVVVPGDQLTLSVTLLKRRANIWKFDGEARVGDEVACTATLINAGASR